MMQFQEDQDNESESSEIESVFDEDKFTIGAAHSGLNVFHINSALQYFTRESIIKKELEDENVELYAANKNIIFAIEKIFNNQIKLKQEHTIHDIKTSINESSKDNPYGLGVSGVSTPHSKHALLVKRFHMDLSLMDNDDDESFRVTLSNSEVGHENNNTSEDVSMSMADDLNEEEDLCVDLVSLFWLMSILPEPAASKCKQIMAKDNLAWKLNAHDIILVFLNWGATLDTLAIEDVLNLPPAQLLSPYSCETGRKTSFPNHSNIVLVLNTITERLPRNMVSKTRALLVSVLVHAALDQGHRRHLANYCRTVRAVLESYETWGVDEADEIVKVLKLERLPLQSAVFVCCSLFNMTCDRLSLVGTLACHALLHHQWGFPAEPYFYNLIDRLYSPAHLLEKFKLFHIHFITSLIHSLFVRSTSQTPPCAQDTISRLHQWTVDLRSVLTQYPFSFSIASSLVRERLSRLTADCSAFMRTLYNSSVNKSLVSQLEPG